MSLPRAEPEKQDRTACARRQFLGKLTGRLNPFVGHEGVKSRLMVRAQSPITGALAFRSGQTLAHQLVDSHFALVSVFFGLLLRDLFL
jgi:hypothetical protein